MKKVDCLQRFRKRSPQRELFVLVSAAFALAAAGTSPQHAIDTARSVITVQVNKAGVFSAFGHNHEIAAPIASGAVDLAARRVELHIRAAALRVRDPDASAKDRAQIQQTMLGPEVLDVEHNPEIGFRSSAIEPAAAGSWTVRGDLTLHGQTQPVVMGVRENGGHYVGTVRFKQSEFGIKPVSFAGGTVRVRDEVRVSFDILLAN